MNNHEMGPRENLDNIEAEDSVWDKEESKIVYAYPVPVAAAEGASDLTFDIPEDQLTKIGPFVIAPSPESHQDQFKWAQDFLVKDGTPVLAAQEGVVIVIVEDSDKWGPSPEFAESLNYVTIMHEKEGVREFSQYCHLGKDSVSRLGLSVGSKIAQGEQIGVVGKTGWTDRDHLHFIIFRAPNGNDKQEIFNVGFKSLIPKFDEK